MHKHIRKHQNKLIGAIIVSEMSHIVCCGLPIFFSILSLLSGLGLVSALPSSFVWLHDVLHHYELPMLIVSALILGLGWLALWYAEKMDCHETGCHHEPCTPRKKTASKVLIVATILFAINISVYFGIHRP